MAVNFNRFKDWAERKFGNIICRNFEIRINSPFLDEDTHHHCWCNVSGVNNKGEDRENGIFHCFKSGTKGSLITLVMLVEKCEFAEAMEILGGENAMLRKLEEDFEEFWENKFKSRQKPKKQIIEEDEEDVDVEFKTITLPPSTYPILDLPSNNWTRCQAEFYLLGRKIPTEGLYVCTAGDYRNRIVIPYYDASGNLIYFNGRHLGDSKLVLRYMGPDKAIGVGKEDVLYVPKWPTPGKKIYLTEGEFDALTIYICGQERGLEIYSGAFGGKNLSEKQIEMIRQYQPILCLDTDPGRDYGKEGLIKMGVDLRAKGLKPRFVRPPKAYKDWNKMLVETSPGILLHYLTSNEKPLNDANLMKLLN
jgi:hypothetical protein